MRTKSSKFTSIIIFLFMGCYSLSAQPALPNDYNKYFINYTGSAKDFIIPYDVSANAITFTVEGGAGGYARVGDCLADGGEGAVAQATFVIGEGDNQLPPGTPLRFITGGGGVSRTGSDAIGSNWTSGGGGGGSAVLAYLNDTWVILAVGGGGGGAYQGMFAWSCVDKQNGQGGRSGTSGGNGEGSLAGSGGSGGQGGNGGGDIGDGDLSGGGGGAFGNGKGGGCSEGASGYPSGGLGGAQGFCIDIIVPIEYAAGGWGFGGGGAGDETGGGGGGYSGGGGGGLTNNGGGGGSYVHPDAIESAITAGGVTSVGFNGHISYQFGDVCTAVISGFEYVNLICSEDGQGRIQLIHDIEEGDYCNAELSFRLLPENGHKHMGNGLFRQVKPGNYTAQVIHAATGFVMTSFSLTAEVSDVAPVALCRDVTVTLNSGAYSNANFHQLINNGSYSDCDDGLILSASQTSFDCRHLGTVSVTLTVAATNNLSSSCQSNVTVQLSSSDTPVAKCYPNRTFNLSTNGSLTLTNSDIDNASITGACFSSMRVSPNSFDCDDLGENIVTLTVDAGPTIQSTCTSIVTITDNFKPEARCRTLNPISLDADGSASITYFDLDVGASVSNNCTELTSYIISKSSFDCSDVGPNQVTLTVTDGYGNSSSCTSTVTIQENTAPLANCRDITVSLDENGAYILDPAELDNGSSDICAFSLSASQTSFDCSDIGTSSITLTVTDEHGAQSSCTADVTVTDDMPPTAVCLNFTVYIPAGSSLTTIAHFTAAATYLSTDNCSDALTRTLLSSPILTCEDLGPNQITYRITDQNNNSSTCTSTFTLEDNGCNYPPAAVCRDITVAADDNCEGTAAAADFDGGSTDADLDDLTFGIDPAGPYAVGATTVTLTVSDGQAEDNCTAKITVVAATTIQTAANAKIWPPDYSYQTFTVGQMVSGLSGACGGSHDDVWIAGVTSDEAEDDPGAYDGATLNDIVISADCRSVQVRRERMSSGNGRVYTVVLAYEIPGGKTVFSPYAISAPRWPWGWYSNAVDDGAVYIQNCGGANASAAVAQDIKQGPNLIADSFQKTPSLRVYPNPFQGETNLDIHLPEAAPATVEIFNTQGQRVRQLFSGDLPAGEHLMRWDGAADGGQALSAGLYLVRLRIGKEVLVKKVSLQGS